MAYRLFAGQQNGATLSSEHLVGDLIMFMSKSSYNETALFTAAENGDLETVQDLIAAQNGHDNVVKILVGAGADKNMCAKYKGSPLNIAFKNSLWLDPLFQSSPKKMCNYTITFSYPQGEHIGDESFVSTLKLLVINFFHRLFDFFSPAC